MKTAELKDLLRKMAHNLNDAAYMLDMEDTSETPAELAEEVMNKLQELFDANEL